jgi:hypothetical protein
MELKTYRHATDNMNNTDPLRQVKYVNSARNLLYNKRKKNSCDLKRWIQVGYKLERTVQIYYNSDRLYRLMKHKNK